MNKIVPYVQGFLGACWKWKPEQLPRVTLYQLVEAERTGLLKFDHPLSEMEWNAVQEIWRELHKADARARPKEIPVMDLSTWRGPDLECRTHVVEDRRWVTVETPWYKQVVVSDELLDGVCPELKWEPETGILIFTVANGWARYERKGIDPLRRLSYFER